jgi:hypothetical protein
MFGTKEASQEMMFGENKRIVEKEYEVIRRRLGAS